MTYLTAFAAWCVASRWPFAGRRAYHLLVTRPAAIALALILLSSVPAFAGAG